MKHPLGKRQSDYLLLGLLLLPACCLTLAGQPQTETTPTQPDLDHETLMYSMGYVIASQIDLEIGLTDAELELVLDGMRDQAKGVAQPANYSERVTAVRDLFMARRSAYQKMLSDVNTAAGAQFFAELKVTKDLKETESGLLYEIIEPGNQEIMPMMEDSVVINFESTHIDASSFDTAQNTTIKLRSNPQSLPGLIEAVKLLGEGGRGIFYLPGSLAFGERPPPGADVKPGEALIFDLELVSVMKTPEKAPMPLNFDPSQMPTSAPPMAPPSGPPPGPPPTLPKDLKRPPPPPVGQ